MEREKLVALVRGLQNEDPNAATELYESFQSDIYYFILKTVNNDRELAEDLTQDTFIEILETIGKLQEPAAFVTWSRQIAYHKCTAYFRKRKELLVDEQEDGYSVFDTIEEDREEFIPDEAMDQEEFKKIIHSIIDKLPVDQRTALLMRYFNEYSVKDIAKIQGVSEGTVKSRLNYARKTIQLAVEAYEKQNDIRLHCSGVLPMLLWFFRAYRRANGMAATVGSASAVFGTATAAAGTTTTAAAATAAAATTTEKTGLAALLSSITKATAAKAVAVVAAVSVTVAGVTAVLSKPEPEVWTGHMQEYTFGWSVENSQEPRPVEEALEGTGMEIRLEILEEEDNQYHGTLEITWEDGEFYQSPCQLKLISDGDEDMYYYLHMDPLFFRKTTSIHYLEFYQTLNITYYKDTGTMLLSTTGSQPSEYAMGELQRQTEGETILLSNPLEEYYSGMESDPFDGPGSLTYMKRLDGTYGWVDIEEKIEIDTSEMRLAWENGLQEEYANLEFEKSREGDYVRISFGHTYEYQEPITHLEIPEEFQGYPVTSVGHLGWSDLVRVQLPETITTVENSAFHSSTRLEQVQLPGSLKTIEAAAFEDCISLKSIEIPQGVETIENRAFKGCNALESLVFPEGLKIIGDQVAYRCEGLKHISLPSTLTELEGYLIYACPNVESLEVAPGNPKFHSSGNCIIETAEKKLINGCKTSEIPADGTVTKIGIFAFAANTGVTEMVIPEGVQEIDYCAFVKCSNLTRITLPRSIKIIHDQAFKDCSSLREISYAGTMEQFGKIQGIRWDAPYHDFRLTVHCSDGDISIG